MNFVAGDSRFGHLRLKLVLFFSVALLLTGIVMYTLAVQQGYFIPKTAVTFEADSGTDLHVGMPVKLSGFPVGSVESMELNSQAHVHVVMLIGNPYMHWIRTDSIAVLQKEGLIGDSIISLQAGSPDLPALAAYGSIKFQAGRGLADIAEDVRNQVVPVIHELNTALQDINAPQGNFHRTLSESRILITELRQTRARTDRLLDHVDHLLQQDGRSTLVDADKSLLDSQHLMRQEIPQLLNQSTITLQHLDQTNTALQQTIFTTQALIDNNASRIHKTLEDGDPLILDSTQLVHSATLPWLFRRSSSAPTTSP
ncbi:MAG: MCE family protein [Pseudomonadales bacterium]|nr:MCE family protein [Pseudomonadales bacterium]